MFVSCCATWITNWVNELHGLCKLRYGLQGGEHSAGFYSQELARGDRKLCWRSLGNLRAPPGLSFCLILEAAATRGQHVVRHTVGPGWILLQTLGGAKWKKKTVLLDLDGRSDLVAQDWSIMSKKLNLCQCWNDPGKCGKATTY